MKTNGSGSPGTEKRDWIIRLGVALLASLIAAVLGPFSTYENFTFSERLFYWGGLIMGLVIPAFFVRRAVYRLLSGPPLNQDLIAGVAVSVTMGPLVWAFNLFAMGFDIGSALLLLEHIVIVFLICLVPVSIRAYMRMSFDDMQAQADAIAENAPVMTEAQAAFVRRLDPEMRGYVKRVSADDHQVVVWTDRGGSKLRLRFGDALEDLMDFDGTRIHRSHWVAYRAIKAVVPDGRRHVVHLDCGTQLPVSQNGLKALQDGGVDIQTRA